MLSFATASPIPDGGLATTHRWLQIASGRLVLWATITPDPKLSIAVLTAIVSGIAIAVTHYSLRLFTLCP